MVLGAVSAAAGIMLAQYIGQNNVRSFGSSFRRNLVLSLAIVAGFWLLCAAAAFRLMSFYTKVCENPYACYGV